MQTYICKCGKTFEKSSKADTTGYVLTDYSPQHECYGCPYIVIERDWQTKEIVKRECRATPKITYLTRCCIGTGGGDFSACYIYSLDLVFIKRVLNFVNTLDGAENHEHAIPEEWRAADFGKCYRSDTDKCCGLATFPLYFKKNKLGTEARRAVKDRFFTNLGYYNAVRKDMTEEQEKEIIIQRIEIAKENARTDCESCGYCSNDNCQVCEYPDTPDDYCVCGDKHIEKTDKPPVKWDGCSPAHKDDVRTALEHICILPVRQMIERGDNSKDIAAYLRSQYKGIAGESKGEWDFTLWYDDGHLYIQYDDTAEQNDNSIDDIIKNTPSMDELEEKASRGEAVSVMDMVNAIKTDNVLNNLGADTISLTWTQAAKELIKMIRASDEEAPDPKEDKTMAAPTFNFGNFISESNTLKQLPLDMLVSRHNHRFKLYDGERLQDMVQSIESNGVLTPIIVLLINEALIKNIEDEMNFADDERKEKLSIAAEFYRDNLDKYEILAGHNRCNAAQLAGKTTVPGIVKENLSYDEAEMYVAETNFMQRGFDDLSITERASVLAARHSAMFDEDKRRAIERELAILNGDEVEEDTEDDEKKSKLAAVGENYGLSKDTVARLIRIDKLVPELKPYVDEGKIAIRAAVNLSYLFTSEQRKVAEMIEFGVDMKKSTLLREVSKQNRLNDNAIREILVMGTYGAAPTTKRKPIKVKISTDISEKYFAPDWDEAKVQNIINLALEQYFSKKLP